MALIEIEKRILANEPKDEAYGQYNFGIVVDDDINYYNMGVQSNTQAETGLYTTVFSKEDYNIENFPDGYINGRGTDTHPSYVKVQHIHSPRKWYEDTSNDKHVNSAFGVWFYDGYETFKGGTGGNGQPNGSALPNWYAMGNIHGENSGWYFKIGLYGVFTGNCAGSSISSGLYTQNNNCQPYGDSYDTDDYLDGELWGAIGGGPGHLMYAFRIGDVDEEWCMVDQLYNYQKSEDWGCNGWPSYASQGFSGWLQWKNDPDRQLPLEYCVGRWSSSGGYDIYDPDGPHFPMTWNSRESYDLSPFHTYRNNSSTRFGDNDADYDTISSSHMTRFENWLKGNADEDVNYNSGTDSSPGQRVGCSFSYTNDANCNRQNDMGLYDGICPDEHLPFYCGPGLISLFRGTEYGSGGSFRGFTNRFGINGTDRINNFHLGWHSSDRPENPPFHQVGPERRDNGLPKHIPDGKHFSDYVIGKGRPGNQYYHRENLFTIVSYLSADEVEDAWGWSPVVDERDRTFYRSSMAKNQLFETWHKQKGEIKVINFVYNENSGYDGSHDHGSALQKYNNEKTKAYRDDEGNKVGYTSDAYINDKYPVHTHQHVRTKVKAPTWNPLNSILSFDMGGMNANWVDKTKEGWHCVNIEPEDTGDDTGLRRGLSPLYNIDFVGWPSHFYTTQIGNAGQSSNENYFIRDLKNGYGDFRPISFVEAIYLENEEDYVEFQGYYEGDSENATKAKILTSAPNFVKLSFQLAESHTDGNPTYIDTNTGNHRWFKHWFFVVDWDWTEGNPGGGECEVDTYSGDCLTDLAIESFPSSQAELASQNVIGLYDLISIDGEDGYETSANHYYITPGIKIIKAVVFTTVDLDSEYFGTDWCLDGDCFDGTNLTQAVRWKLVTIKVNLNGDLTFPGGDFAVVGGDEFTYLPMPNMVNLNYQGEAPSGNTYKPSHVVIGGLSPDSQYVKSIDEIYRRDDFTETQMEEKSKLLRARNLTPSGNFDEIGDYLGSSDISQIRYFNSALINGEPNDMRKLLGINSLIDTDNDQVMEFYPYNDFNYWTGDPFYFEGNEYIESPTFPEKSPIGDIFISDYKEFRENCLFEFNLSDIDDKSVKDTAGNGNKGVLIGDFSIKKSPGAIPIRDSYIEIPEKETDNGAF